MTSLNRVRKRRLIAKETSIANCEVLDEKYRITVHGIFSVGIIIKAGDLRKQTGCLPSLFVKNKPGKLVSLLVGCLLLFLKVYVLKIGENCRGKY